MEKRVATQYEVFDDVTNDASFGNVVISPSTVQTYKYFGLPFGSSVSTPNTFGSTGTAGGMTRGYNVQFVSLTVRGQVYIASAGGIEPDMTNTLRMIWYWDNDAAVTSSTGTVDNHFPTTNSHVLGTVQGPSPTISAGSVFSGYNPTMVGPGKRFKILRDKTYRFSANGTGVYSIFLKLRLNKKVGMPNIQAGTNVLAQNVACCMISDSAVFPSPNISFSWRLCYAA